MFSSEVSTSWPLDAKEEASTSSYCGGAMDDPDGYIKYVITRTKAAAAAIVVH